MRIANPSAIYGFIPILESGYDIFINHQNNEELYFSSYYPLTYFNNETVMSTHNSDDLETVVIKRENTELGIHHEIINVPAELLYSENGAILDQWQEVDVYTMRNIPVELYYLGYDALNQLETRFNLDSDHPLLINNTFSMIALSEEIHRSIDYISNLYRLIDGDCARLQSYLKNLYSISVVYDEETGNYDATHFQIDAETHRLWSAFVYDYFGRERDYLEIPKLSHQKLMNARFTLKVNDNQMYRDKPIFNELLFGKQLDRFTLSDILIGTSEGVRFHQNEDIYTADQLRFMLQESEIRFADQDTRQLFYSIWKEIMQRDISGLSDLFTDDMIQMLSENFIPLYTVYDPGNKERWEFRGKEEINLAMDWQYATLAMIEFKPDNGFLHYKLTDKTAEDKYFEIMFDMLKWFTNNFSRTLQKTWMILKGWGSWMYRVLERY
jgi:hypothetical protein